MSHVKCHISNVTCPISIVICQLSHVKCYMSNVTCWMSHVNAWINSDRFRSDVITNCLYCVRSVCIENNYINKNTKKWPNKSEMKDLFIFPCYMSWTMTFVSETLDRVSNLASKICIFLNFHFFWKSKKSPSDHSKKCSINFSEWKIRDEGFVHFSVLYIMDYDIWIRDPGKGE